MQQRNRRPRHCRGTFGGTVVAPVQGDIGRVTKQSSDKRSAFKKNVGQSDQPEIDRRGQRQGLRCRGVRICSAAALSRAALRIGSVQRFVTLGTQRGRWRSVCGDAAWTGQWEIGHVPRFVTPGLHIIGRSSPPRTLSARFVVIARARAKGRSTLRTLSERFLVRVGGVTVHKTPVLDAGRTARSLSALAAGGVLALRFGRLSHQLARCDLQRHGESGNGRQASSSAGLEPLHGVDADTSSCSQFGLRHGELRPPVTERRDSDQCCSRRHPWHLDGTGRHRLLNYPFQVTPITTPFVPLQSEVVSFPAVCKNPCTQNTRSSNFEMAGGCG
jgi:hypothetical protein